MLVCRSATPQRLLEGTEEVNWTLFYISHVAFFLFFFRWFEWRPFTAWELSSSSRPLVSRCWEAGGSEGACFFSGKGAFLFFTAVRGDPRQDADRQLVPWEVEGASRELFREVEEVEEGGEGKEHLDWCVRDGRCWLFVVWLFFVVSSVALGLGELMSALVVVRSICSLSTTCVRRTKAWELSCTVSDMRSVAAAIFSPRSLMSLVLFSMELAASCTVDLNSSRLSCLASSTGGISTTRWWCMGLGGAVRMRGPWLWCLWCKPGWM